MAGFGLVRPLPGIIDDFELNSAITLPIGVETYAAYAMSVWLGANDQHRRSATFARWSAIGSLILGALGQVAYHLMVAAGIVRAPWWIVTVVACLPVAVFGMGAALAHLVRTERAEDRSAEREANAETERAERDRVAAAREAAARQAEANAETERLRLDTANAETERVRLKAERKANGANVGTERGPRTHPNGKPNVTERGTANGANAAPNTGTERTPNDAPDQGERDRTGGGESADAFAAWLAREGTGTPMSSRELSRLTGTSVDAARVQAGRWRKRVASPESANTNGVTAVVAERPNANEANA